MDFSKLRNVKVERDDGITWVILNRPEKRNAMSPELHFEMDETLQFLETDPETRCLILTGAGPAYCAGQDLQKFFRETENDRALRKRSAEAANRWRWERLYMYEKPTIAMVNGYCVGGAFMHMVACDFAIADEKAIFSLSEVNWGALPGSLVARAVTEAVGYRDAIDICSTGRAFTGEEAARMRLVTRAVPTEQLREETVTLARSLMEKNPIALMQAKRAVRMVRTMDFTQSYNYLAAMSNQITLFSGSQGRAQGMKQFLDEKSYKPTFGTYKHDLTGPAPSRGRG
jgi:trans-feruloyl-CoA hydratase/vanillin synthase